MKIESVLSNLDSINFNSELKIPNQFDKSAPSFSTWLGEKVSETNTQLLKADEALKQLAFGQNVNLHQTMILLEQAKLSFQFLEQVRNRLMSAYQELMREQI